MDLIVIGFEEFKKHCGEKAANLPCCYAQGNPRHDHGSCNAEDCPLKILVLKELTKIGSIDWIIQQLWEEKTRLKEGNFAQTPRNKALSDEMDKFRKAIEEIQKKC